MGRQGAVRAISDVVKGTQHGNGNFKEFSLLAVLITVKSRAPLTIKDEI